MKYIFYYVIVKFIMVNTVYKSLEFLKKKQKTAVSNYKSHAIKSPFKSEQLSGGFYYIQKLITNALVINI